MSSPQCEWLTTEQGLSSASMHGYHLTVEKVGQTTSLVRFRVWADDRKVDLFAAGIRVLAADAMTAAEAGAERLLKLVDTMKK